jgi:hypothetical protein
MSGAALDIIIGSSFSDRSQIRSILLAKLSSAITHIFLPIMVFISFLCLRHVSNRMTSKFIEPVRLLQQIKLIAHYILTKH